MPAFAVQRNRALTTETDDVVCRLDQSPMPRTMTFNYVVLFFKIRRVRGRRTSVAFTVQRVIDRPVSSGVQDHRSRTASASPDHTDSESDLSHRYCRLSSTIDVVGTRDGLTIDGSLHFRVASAGRQDIFGIIVGSAPPKQFAVAGNFVAGGVRTLCQMIVKTWPGRIETNGSGSCDVVRSSAHLFLRRTR